MAELEKVIDALRRCESYGYCEDKQCPYYECTGCLELLRSDALALLKAQEALAAESAGSTCCKINNRGYPKSCGCGQAVKWPEPPKEET